jgi:hypothetical protein
MQKYASRIKHWYSGFYSFLKVNDEIKNKSEFQTVCLAASIQNVNEAIEVFALTNGGFQNKKKYDGRKTEKKNFQKKKYNCNFSFILIIATSFLYTKISCQK